MKSDRAQTVLLGLFVTVAGAIALAALTTVTSFSSFLEDRPRVTADFDVVQGLQPGDAVWFSGVPVGEVREVSLTDHRSVEVDMAIHKSQAGFIPANVVARTSSDGIIGNAIIVLEGGTSDAGPIQAGASLETVPTLSADEMMTELSATNEKLQEIAGNLAQATRPLAEGEGTVGRLLTEEDLYDDLAMTARDARATASSARSGATSFARFGRQLQDPDKLPQRLLNDTELHETLSDGVADLGGAADNLDVVSSELRTSAQATDTPLGVLLHDRQAGGDLGATLDHLNTSSLVLTENLEAMQRSFLLKPLFPSKKKAAARREEHEAQADRDAAAVIADGP